ncbi:MAG: hypothetical protein EOO88_37830 [Pedobacter sp.]|nr:MAG: hypothetical protein EOO88_37830 [Pedobacter sp.]
MLDDTSDREPTDSSQTAIPTLSADASQPSETAMDISVEEPLQQVQLEPREQTSDIAEQGQCQNGPDTFQSASCKPTGTQKR